jgi:hypothetical protein
MSLIIELGLRMVVVLSVLAMHGLCCLFCDGHVSTLVAFVALALLGC